MYKFGCSLTSHYRLLESAANIESLCSYFIKHKGVDILELGFGGAANYDLFYQAYSNSTVLRRAGKYKTSINLHLPRKDWELIGPRKVVSDTKNLMHKFAINNLVIHEVEFNKYKKVIKSISNKLYIESNGLHNCHRHDDNIKIACDINHFYINNTLSIKNLNNFVIKNKRLVKEFHFSNRNHDVFNKKNILFFVGVFDNLRKIINLDNKKIIFEGTDRSKDTLRGLKKTLNINIKLIKKLLNLCTR